MHVMHSARVTLLATALNNLALAVIVAGFIAPATMGALHGGGQIVAAIAWSGFGTALSGSARITLDRMRS